MNIPMLDLVEQYRHLRKEIDREVKSVMKSGGFILGPKVEAFEKAMAEYCGTKYAVGCASGTDALMMALMAIGIKPGDEVITTPFSFAATAEVILLLGARPVYVDIRPDTYNIDENLIEKAVTRKTKAIIPVHLYGQAAEMNEINRIAEKRGLVVIEDACQAVGAEYKGKKTCSLGHMGCLSFFPSKNLGAYGDGGMVLTSDRVLAQKLLMIRNHGSDKRYVHTVLGINSRLDAMQAVILHVKLKYLDGWNEARQDRAALYNELLKNSPVVTPVTLEAHSHVFHQYSIRVENRDGLRGHLEKSGIASAIHYPIPLHLQQAYRIQKKKEGSFPVAEEVSGKILSLPMYPELKEEVIQRIAGEILSFVQ